MAAENVIVIFCVAVAVTAVCLARCISYRLTDTGLEVLWFGVPVKRVAYSDVREVRRTSIGQCFSTWQCWTALRFGNRFGRPVVLIRKRRGIFRNLLITPDDAEEFVQNVLRQVPQPTTDNRQPRLKPLGTPRL